MSHPNLAIPISSLYQRCRLMVILSPIDDFPETNLCLAAGNVYNNRIPNTWMPKRAAGLRYYDTPIFRPLWPFFLGSTSPIPSCLTVSSPLNLVASALDFLRGHFVGRTDDSAHNNIRSCENTKGHDEFGAELQRS